MGFWIFIAVFHNWSWELRARIFMYALDPRSSPDFLPRRLKFSGRERDSDPDQTSALSKGLKILPDWSTWINKSVLKNLNKNIWIKAIVIPFDSFFSAGETAFFTLGRAAVSPARPASPSGYQKPILDLPFHPGGTLGSPFYVPSQPLPLTLQLRVPPVW